LEQFLQANGAYEQSLNTEAYRALGAETTVEGGIGRNIFLRGGYTYLDAVVQRSFANDDGRCWGRFRRTMGFLWVRIRRCKEHVRSGARRIRGS